MLQVFEFLRIYRLHLWIAYFAILDQREQNVGGQRLDLQIQLLGHLALLEALVDAPDVLAQSRIIIIFDAVVRPVKNYIIIISFRLISKITLKITYLPLRSFAMSAHLLP